MYTRQNVLAAKASASMVANNLSATVNLSNGLTDLVFLHKSVAHLLLAQSSSSEVQHKHIIVKIPSSGTQVAYILVVQADWVEVSGRKILVLATQKGIKIYDADGSTLEHWYGFGAEGQGDISTRGICSLGSSSLCIGAQNGLMIFNIPSNGGQISLSETIADHEEPVTTVKSTEDYIVSGDEGGNIFIRTHSKSSYIETVNRIAGDGQPCTCLDIWKNLIVAGFSSGMMKIYDLSTGRLLGDISAHSRSVNGLQFAQGSGKCVTCSEDSFVRVWEFVAGETPQVRLAFSESITDHQLVGAQFTDNLGMSFAVTAYDSTEIFKFVSS